MRYMEQFKVMPANVPKQSFLHIILVVPNYAQKKTNDYGGRFV